MTRMPCGFSPGTLRVGHLRRPPPQKADIEETSTLFDVVDARVVSTRYGVSVGEFRLRVQDLVVEDWT